MPWFKVNHQDRLDWVTGDCLTFVVIAAEFKLTSGFSSCVYSNRKQQRPVTKCFKTVGHYTIRTVTEFDVKLETEIIGLTPTMKVINKDPLRVFLKATPSQPLSNMSLIKILEHNSEILDDDRFHWTTLDPTLGRLFH